MSSRSVFRAVLGLVAIAVLGATVLTSGFGTVGDTETIASVRDTSGAETTTTRDPDVARQARERAAAERAERQAAAAQAEADERAAAQAAADEAAAVEAAAAQAAADEAAAIEAAEAEARAAEIQAAEVKAAEELASFKALEEQAAAEAAASAASARPAGVPDDFYWDRMARCETASNWSHYPDGRWSGGLGIYVGTWETWGGKEFAPNAGYATRDQQIIVANRIATQGYGNVAPVGYSGWGCVKTIGYP